ncbi:protein tyrosine kinase [Teladorsagia circumcincta]|uniref:Protein tyrosine kinase n=1 Tax=Teladorsagia circumcincta TaxID=45464 RepID=A0A2G9TYD9_TELCI|nr:protein tyrosine kinase [Teladorsagia circumcincta]
MEPPMFFQLQAGQFREKLEMGHFDEEYELMLANIFVEDLEKEEWYHGCLPLDDIMNQLKKNGDFLLRLAHGEGGKSSTMKLCEENKAKIDDMHREARMMRQYKHRHVVAFHGVVNESADRVMIVMELINGGGLDHYLQKNPNIHPLMKTFYAANVAFGLMYLHSKRCMHRQAPEVIATRIYTPACDVYSYGILVWEIFNDAEMPFKGIDNKTIKAKISEPDFRPNIDPAIPPNVKLVMKSCWSGDPAQRPTMKRVFEILLRKQWAQVEEELLHNPEKQEVRAVERSEEENEMFECRITYQSYSKLTPNA